MRFPAMYQVFRETCRKSAPQLDCFFVQEAGEYVLRGGPVLQHLPVRAQQGLTSMAFVYRSHSTCHSNDLNIRGVIKTWPAFTMTATGDSGWAYTRLMLTIFRITSLKGRSF